MPRHTTLRAWVESKGSGAAHVERKGWAGEQMSVAATWRGRDGKERHIEERPGEAERKGEDKT